MGVGVGNQKGVGGRKNRGKYFNGFLDDFVSDLYLWEGTRTGERGQLPGKCLRGGSPGAGSDRPKAHGGRGGWLMHEGGRGVACAVSLIALGEAQLNHAMPSTYVMPCRPSRIIR